MLFDRENQALALMNASEGHSGALGSQKLLLAADVETRQSIMAARPIADPPGLCTIGYEGRSLEAFLDRLLCAGVTLLCDVRRNPLSRKYGFSKRTLSTACSGVSIRYEHLPELGIASEERRELKTQADYDALFAHYAVEWLPKQTDALKRIRSWIAEGARGALTCYERLPEQCHRHCVADLLTGCDEVKGAVIHL